MILESTNTVKVFFLLFFTNALIHPASLAEFKEIDPGNPLNPDDVMNAETISFDEESDDILSNNLEMAAQLNEKIALEGGEEAKVFQGKVNMIFSIIVLQVHIALSTL